MRTHRQKTVQITLTERCNLNCVYCYETNKSTDVMSFDVFREIIERSFEECGDCERIEFDFHGGEVGLVLDELTHYCEWLWSREWPRPYRCFATTNGTLVHGKWQDWFARNSGRICLGLSLDGTRDMHNANRSDSYDKIDLQFFRKTWPQQGCKMTISPMTLPCLFEGVVHLCELGFAVSANLAFGPKWEREMLAVYERELARLVEYFASRPDLEVPNLLDFPIERLGHVVLTGKDPDPRWCGSGRLMACYSSTGRRYPCQMFMGSTGCSEVGLGRVYELMRSDAPLDDPKCKECFLLGVCPTCYGQSYLQTGDPCCRCLAMCDFRKLEAQASVKLLAKRMKSEQWRKARSQGELQRLAAGALQINRGAHG